MHVEMHVEAGAPRRPAVAAAVRALVVFDALAFLLAGLLHLSGARIPLGGAEFVEPRIPPAGIVEGLAGIAFAVGAYGVLASRRWAWAGAVVAHTFALAGVLLGMWAIAAGYGPHSAFNDAYHRAMLVVLAAGAILLLTPAGLTALDGGGQSTGDNGKERGRWLR